MAGLFGLFRAPKPAPDKVDDSSSASASSSPSSEPGHTAGRKRRASSSPSGRSASVVAKRWSELDSTVPNMTAEALKKNDSTIETTSWMDSFNLLRLARGGSEDKEALSKSQSDVEVDMESDDADLFSEEGSLYEDDGLSDGDDDDDDSTVGGRGRGGRRYRMLPTPQRQKVDTLSASFQGTSLNKAAVSNSNLIPLTDQGYQTDEDTIDEDETEEDTSTEDEGEAEDWAELFEPEPSKYDDGRDITSTNSTDDICDWPVEEAELKAYEDGMTRVRGFHSWTRDEKLTHRLLSLRGFHPLMPNTWSRDFLGVPMYPSLFAPADQAEKPVAIYNMSSQFRATKALRSIFDLQSRVSGLRQTGNTARIGAIIEKELRRYIAWAQRDAGLDRCVPLAEMPNIVVKQFSVHARRRKGQGPGPTRGLIRRMQDYFREWAAAYRKYYAALPAFVDTTDGSGQTQRRLRPPRLLYGFVIVQHAVMLLAIDAARPRARPKCFANFNMSLGDHWLDASLNVAVPVHLARAAQMRCVEGLDLPVQSRRDSDDDA